MNFLGDVLDILSSKILYPAYCKFKKDNQLNYVSEVEEFNKLSCDKISEFKIQKIRFIVEYAYKNTIYYNSLFKSIGLKDFSNLTLEDLKQIPVLTKDIIREEGDNLLSKRYSKKNMRKTATGGTTASPVPFYSDFESMYRKRSATIAFDKWCGYSPGLRSVYLWQARQDLVELKGIKQRLLNALVFKNYFFPGSPLDDSIMEKYYNKIKKISPVLLQAYPTPLEIFANFLLKNNYKLKINSITTTAEPLLDNQISLIEKVFNTKPINWYGAREAGRIATECRERKGMHINEYCLHLEIDKNNFTEENFGSILITDLWNIGMPLIRYEIGDIGVISNKNCDCGCNLTRLMNIYGRVNDTFVNSKKQKIPGVWFPNQFLINCDEIKEMQIVQFGIQEFKLLVVKGDRFSESTEGWVKAKLNEFMHEDNSIEIIYVANIPKEKSGKTRFCKNIM